MLAVDDDGVEGSGGVTLGEFDVALGIFGEGDGCVLGDFGGDELMPIRVVFDAENLAGSGGPPEC